MRIAGISIPKEKRIIIALTYVYGIGPTLSKKILTASKIDQDLHPKDLTPDQEGRLRAIIESEHLIEGDLRRSVGADIKRLKDIKCYRGIRHSKHLTVRGQRTKRNSRTVRGNTRKTMGSGRVKSGIKT